MRRAVLAVVHGRVQGVGFRWAAAQRASALGVGGWVRNRGDGAVEVFAQGDQVPVQTMLDWLAEGPRYAWVDQVEINEQPLDDHSGFRIR